MLLSDLRNAVIDAVTKWVTVTVASPGVPKGEIAFNPGETVTYSVTIKNASDGGQLKNVRLHVQVSDESMIKLIVPPTTTATAYKKATGTAVWTPGTEQADMFLSTPSLSVLSPGDSETFGVLVFGQDPLTVKGIAVGSPAVSAEIRADVDMDWLIPPNNTGAPSSKTFNIVT